MAKHGRRQPIHRDEGIKPGHEEGQGGAQVVSLRTKAGAIEQSTVEFGTLSNGARFVFPRRPESPKGDCPVHVKVDPPEIDEGKNLFNHTVRYGEEEHIHRGWISLVTPVIPL